MIPRGIRFLFCLLALHFSVRCVNAQPAGTAPQGCARKATIGVILPLSGGPVSSGVFVQNSILLASAKNDPQQCVRFIFEDDQLVPKNTVSAFAKLADQDRVDGLIVYGTPTSLAVVDAADAKHLPMIALSILGRVVANRQYVVKHWCTAERLNEAVDREVRRRKYASVAVVSTVNDAMLGLRDLFRSSGAAAVLLDEEFSKDDFDFRTIAVKIKQRQPSAVYVLLYPPQPNAFIRMLREAGYRGDLFGVHNVEDPAEVQAARGEMEGMWLANGDDSAGEHYRDDYRARFGADPGLGGASGYDAAKLFIGAAASGQDLNSYLHTVRSFSGAFGVYNASGKNDFDFPAVIKTIHGDKFEKQIR